ncbi:MAG TPA: AMP-binding protein [Kofleriaceae bacterium]|nr:AMP-binding protein [Kofleriaceae bacterium]
MASFDASRYQEVKPAPLVVLEGAAARGDAPRFQVRAANGPGETWVPVSWARFADELARVAAFLPGVGLAPGDRAALFGDNSVPWAAAALGIQAAGGVMVPVYPASTADQLGYILEHGDVRVLFVQGAAQLQRTFEVWPQCNGVHAVVLLGDEDVAAALEAADPITRPTPAELDRKLIRWSAVMQTSVDVQALTSQVARLDLDAPTLMLYTSGTSGRPKGVALTHANIGLNAAAWIAHLSADLHDDGVDLMWLPMSHIFGFGELCLGNTLGFTTYMTTPREVLDLLPVVRPSVFMSVPAYWEKLAGQALAAGDAVAAAERLERITGGTLRFCLSGGAGLKREVKDLFHSAGILIIEGYGLTECSPTLTLNRREAFRFDSVGKPLAGVDVTLADDGEILARGPNIFAGYHKDPEATAAAFTDDGWFKTGDLGRFTEDGFLQIVGRKKEILVTAGGKNVPPANIEMLFADDPDLEHVVVYGDGKKYLVAGVWLAPGVSLARAEIEARIARVNAGLARHETIKKLFVAERPLTVEDGLLTASLKLRRKHVYAAFEPEFEALYQ